MDKFCRGCLFRYEEPTDLLQYTEKNRRLFVYSTGIQVKRTDAFTFQLCKDCYLNMKSACNFKKQCRSSDKRFKSYLGLKDSEDSVDLSTFLKNNDDSWSFRFPGNSTPAYQRVKEDDNESTTTSIRNFMMDIMPDDDDLPDTEARIIREVIDEEADVLEDSLDSHWLQDDASIDTDFRLDFSFSPFSTPRPVNNDRYTPIKEPKQLSVKQTNQSKQISKTIRNNLDNLDMPLLDDESNHSLRLQTLEGGDEPIEALITTKEEINQYKETIMPKQIEINDKSKILIQTTKFLAKEIEIEKYNHTLIPITLERDDVSNEIPTDDIENNRERNFDETMDSLDVVNEFLKYETESAANIDETPAQCAVDTNLKDALESIITPKDTIDRNLEEALKNSEDKEFSLDDLLVSPRVIPSLQSPPTPLINNILFGDKLDIDENSSDSHKYKSGQCIETYENVTGEVEMTEDFTIDIKIQDDLDIEELKTEIIEEIDRQANQDIEQSELECKLCSKKFDNLQLLERHCKRHQIVEELMLDDDVKEEKIEDSTRRNNQFEVKEKEQESQFDIKNFYCNMCKKKFTNVKTLKIHAKRHQAKNEPKKKWICDHCGKGCNDRTNLLRHIQTHVRSKPKYECTMCKLEFSAKHALQQHSRTHMGEPPQLLPSEKRFVCPECGFSTDNANTFGTHMNRHEKKYTHTCTECGKGFFRQSDLTIHMRYHTGEKPFSCPHCDKSFARRDALTKHVKLHLDLKPFQCEFCKSRFTVSNNLKNHLKRSKLCMRDREAMAAKQKKADENDSTKTFVTEEIVKEKSVEE